MSENNKSTQSNQTTTEAQMQVLISQMSSISEAVCNLGARLDKMEGSTFDETKMFKEAKEDKDVDFDAGEPSVKFDNVRRKKHIDSASSTSDSNSSENDCGTSRRDSLRRSLNKSAKKHSKQNYIRTHPDYSHIKLKTLKPYAVLYFFKEAKAFEALYDIDIPVASLISNDIRDILISDHNRITSSEFYGLDEKKLYRLLQKQLRPSDPLSFYNDLNTNIKFKWTEGTSASPSNFKEFRQAIGLYRQEFVTMYEFLSYKNDSNVPGIHNREGGLVRLFVEKIPFQYGKMVMQKINKVSFDSIDEFLDAFRKEVDKTYQHSKAHVEFTNLFQYTKIHTTPTRTPTRHSIHNINNIDNTNDLYTTEYHIEDVYSDEDQPSKVAHEEVEQDTQELHAIGPIQSRGCLQLLVNGKCERIKCNYMHDATSMAKLHQEMTNRLNTSNFSPARKINNNNNTTSNIKPSTTNSHIKQSTTSIKPSHIPTATTSVRTDKSHFLEGQNTKGPNVVPKTTSRLNTSKIHNMEQDFSSEEHIEEIDNSVDQQLYNICCTQFPEITYNIQNSVYREATIKTSNGQSIHVPKVLFDTGALHANYISKRWIDMHRDQLSAQIHHKHARVKMADSKTMVTIDEIATLHISFVDSRGTEHIIEDSFCVMETGTNDIIIGLPTILLKLLSYFFEMLTDAVSNHHHTLTHIEDSTNNHNDQSKVFKPPWTTRLQEAPEDDNTPMPSSFSGPLNFLAKPHEEVIQEYLSLFDSHIAPEFAKSTPVLELLHTKGAKVFAPSEWLGISAVEPLELTVHSDMPRSIKPRTRPINPRLFENAKTEFERLRRYFYVPSTSPIASPLVIAPKATPPYIRFCGDYVAINKYLVASHCPIPRVMDELHKIIGFQIFIDLDWTHSYHQFRLAPVTSALLSVQTPWGQFQPLFMPEGVSPASGILQAAVANLFADFEPWTIAIFDNLLILATDYDDAYMKLELVIDRCIKYYIILKFSKSWLGFTVVQFFGYQCTKNSFTLTSERKLAVSELPFPNSLKKMRQFLGTANFFQPFVPGYAMMAAPLSDMTKANFPWSKPDTWQMDYRKCFDDFKVELLKCFELFYPDYTLPWVLYVDASDFAIGGVLAQTITKDNVVYQQPIVIFSHKLSDQAKRWDTIEKEAYAIYYGVQKCNHLLRCKFFTLRTDHNNLVWMEASQVPKIVRWRLYLQSFNFVILHISGKDNSVADWLSRMEETTTLETHCNLLEEEDIIDPVDEVLSQVHGGRAGHHGIRRTWLMLNQKFPGHHITYDTVREYVTTCAICQKTRLGMVDTIEPVVRTLKPQHMRSMIGYDHLTITPPDAEGNKVILAVINHGTKLTTLYPLQEYTAEAVATCLFRHFVTYGLTDAVISDPGSAFTSIVIEELHRYFGVKQYFSIVNRHESSGVERTNREILRHLRALVNDERCKDRWSNPTVIGLIQYIINSSFNNECHGIPYELTFGTDAGTYCKLPETATATEWTQHYVRMLNEDLKSLQDTSLQFQRTLAEDRMQVNNRKFQQVFQVGDRVLHRHDPTQPLPTKLSTPFSGPYEVLHQYKNDVTCKHMCQGTTHTFHVTNLKIFHGDRESAEQAAQWDHDQFKVDNILSYRGDPFKRSQIEFLVRFEDGSEIWKQWCIDITNTAAFERYCRSIPYLNTLLYTIPEAKRWIKSINQAPIVNVLPGTTVYVPIIYFGYDWLHSLNLPELPPGIAYVMEFIYTKWTNRAHTRIDMKCILFNKIYEGTSYFVFAYGSQTQFDPDKMVLVDNNFAALYPDILA